MPHKCIIHIHPHPHSSLSNTPKCLTYKPYPETPRVSLTYTQTRSLSLSLSPNIEPLPHTPHSTWMYLPFSLIHTHLDLEFCLDSTIWVLCVKTICQHLIPHNAILFCAFGGGRKNGQRGLCVSRNPFLKGSQAPFPSRTPVIIGFTYWVWMITGIILRSIQKPSTWSRPEKPQKVVMDCWSVMAYIL